MHWTLKRAEKHRGVHSLFGLGAIALVLCESGAIVELGRLRCKGWRIGTKRFSLHCAKEYLTHANDKAADQELEAARALSEKINYSDLHTYPRVAPLVCTDYPVSIQEDDDEYNAAVESAHELAMYDEFIEFATGGS